MSSYSKRIVSIYVTYFFSIVLGLISVFIVTPYLTSNKDIYGVYSICLSLTIFYSYADIGFTTSGLKFASEAYINKLYLREMSIIGFSGFVLFVFVGLISLCIFFLAFHADWLISDLEQENAQIARKLLLILALSAPVYSFQRMLNMYYSARLLDYYCQSFAIFGNVVKIISVFYFFFSC